MMLVYSFAMTCLLAITSPVWGWRMLWQGRYRQGLRQRLGEVPAQLRAVAQGRPVIWLHAVSVGETLAATRLVSDLQAALPDHILVISTTTPTGQAVARERFADGRGGVDRVFFYPLDFAFAVRPYLQALQPRLLILMESELWPRTLVECERMRVPVAVVNARMSDRSQPRYRALRVLWKPLLQRVSLLLAQSSEDARRWVEIGARADRVQSTGNLKYDVRSAGVSPLAQLLQRHLPHGAAVMVCGSTHEGEETLLLDCVRGLPSKPVMILAPRHPERVPRVEQLAADRGMATTRLSTWRLASAPILPGSVLLVDTVGELAALYALARAAFVGGSLVPHGGQNPLEPAQFGVPILMGSSYENFRDIVARMQAAGAIQVVQPEELCGAVASLLSVPRDDSQKERSVAVFEAESGATARVVAALLRLLQVRLLQEHAR